MNDLEQYKNLMNEIIAKQAIILGSEISILKAKNVSALVISSDGHITDVKGDPQEALKKLIDEYVELSGMIVKNALGSIFAKYPTIEKVE